MRGRKKETVCDKSKVESEEETIFWKMMTVGRERKTFPMKNKRMNEQQSLWQNRKTMKSVKTVCEEEIEGRRRKHYFVVFLQE